MARKQGSTKKVKINWSRELHSTHVLAIIESYLNTYWDEEYILWKIRKEIAKWRGKEIEDIMETNDPIEYLLTKRRSVECQTKDKKDC